MMIQKNWPRSCWSCSKPLKDLSKDHEKFNVAIGIIATPGQYAQAIADELINCGVRSILPRTST